MLYEINELVKFADQKGVPEFELFGDDYQLLGITAVSAIVKEKYGNEQFYNVTIDKDTNEATFDKIFKTEKFVNMTPIFEFKKETVENILELIENIEGVYGL